MKTVRNWVLTAFLIGIFSNSIFANDKKEKVDKGKQEPNTPHVKDSASLSKDSTKFSIDARKLKGINYKAKTKLNEPRKGFLLEDEDQWN